MSEPDDIADGQDHPLDPRFVPMQRVSTGLFMAAVATVPLGVLIIVNLAADGLSGGILVMLGILWLVIAAIAAWLARRLPVLHYEHTRYRVDEAGIEIRRGIYWRVVINVPRSRVQHIDVGQGPLERRYGLGKLVLYTAGTDHAKVELAGLEHGRALRIREHLLPAGMDDAV